MKDELANIPDFKGLIETIREIILTTRTKVIRNVNFELIVTYWKIGKELIESEQLNQYDSESSRQLILILSKELTNTLGKGFFRTTLLNMRKFYVDETYSTPESFLNEFIEYATKEGYRFVILSLSGQE